MKKHRARISKHDAPEEKYHAGSKTAGRRRAVTFSVAIFTIVVSGILFTLMLLKIPNMHVIFFLFLGAMALLIIYLVLWTLRANEKYARLAVTLRRCYFVCIAAGVAFFITLQCLIISGAHTDDAEADCILILGAGLRNDVPSLVLRRRLNKAVEYLNAHEDIPVIVSGGLGRGESITEAEAMYRYLVGRDVDASLIWKEEASTSTKENITFSLALIEEKGIDAGNVKIAIVTNEFHLYRAKLIAGKAGVDAIGISAETPGIYLRVLYSCREAFALAAEVLT
jgi:uncharacterized SAM-binding protein YcdF (DUF218 family)